MQPRFRVVVQRREPRVHLHPGEARASWDDADARHPDRHARPRPRLTSWIAVLYRDERRVFDSRWVSLELKTERGARWLAGLVERAVTAGVFAPPTAANVPPGHRAPIAWTRQGEVDRDDDTVCAHGPYEAHVEWLSGPYGKGGVYSVGVMGSVSSPHAIDFHSVVVVDDVGVRSGEAGRFLAELLVDLAGAGIAIPPIR